MVCFGHYETFCQRALRPGALSLARSVMRGVTRSLTIVLAGAAVVFMPTLFGREVAAGQAGGSAQASSDRARFVGTYEIVTTEVKDAATGKWSPTPNFNSNGYIIYAETGH